MKIDKNIKCPEVGSNPHKASNQKYPWDEMEVGDSLFFKGYSFYNQNKYGTVARAWARRNRPNWKFITRRDGDGVRVFRVK